MAGTEEKQLAPAAAAQETEPTGDQNGEFGFGRRAHTPDPNATYEFKPEDRVLPLNPKTRWR